MLETGQIEKMTTAERLQAMEQLWEALCREGDDMKSPAWHQDVLAERKARAKSGESKFLTLEQLQERLRA